MRKANFADVTYSNVCTNIGELGRKWQDKQKTVVLMQKNLFQIHNKEEINSSENLNWRRIKHCSEIKHFSSRKKLVVHKRSRIVILWSWMCLFDLLRSVSPCQRETWSKKLNIRAFSNLYKINCCAYYAVLLRKIPLKYTASVTFS